jgi:hypothetical protein
MTDSPAITSQKNKDNSASIWDAINHIKIGLRDGEAGFVSTAVLPGMVSLAEAVRRVFRKAGWDKF